MRVMGLVAFIPLAVLGCIVSQVPAPRRSIEVYSFPLRAEDLEPGERISTGDHLGGIQSLGKDLGIVRPAGTNGWSGYRKGVVVKPGETRNQDFVIYGRPFHAMADGEVVGCWRNAPENPRPGVLS